jgi:hypothetical protein
MTPPPTYVIPTSRRLRAGGSFQPGPWNLGRRGRPVAAGSWRLVSARKWFTGPRRIGSIDTLIELEAHSGENA